MALARIVTRSHKYSQQLALDLLARGYTVEIVAPDAVPSRPADLELRVEGGEEEAQGRITEIREGKYARSVEYLQRVKPLMADLLRKWPSTKKPADQVPETEQTPAFSFNGELESSDEMEFPGTAEQQRPEPTPAEPTPLLEPGLESSRLVAPKQKSESAFSITGEPLVWDGIEERGGSEVWFWRAAVGFAATALLIVVFGMALWRNPAAPPSPSSAGPAQTASVKIPEQLSVNPSPALSNPALLAKAPVIEKSTQATLNLPKSKPTAAIRRTKEPQYEEVVNGDTTVTHFTAKTPGSAKAPMAKEDSAIKHYSDLN